MIHRRQFIASAAWSAVAASAAHAAAPTADEGFGSPAATAPFAPEVYRERRARLMADLKTGVGLVDAAADLNASGSEAPGPHQASDFALEDDYLVTDSGNEHPSRAVPRAPAEIEALLARR